MDDVDYVLHQGYIRFAHSLIEKVIENSSAETLDANPQLFAELRDAWLEELSSLVDMSDKKPEVKVNVVSNVTASAASTTPIRSHLLLTPLPKLNLGAGHRQPKRKLNEGLTTSSKDQPTNEENNQQDEELIIPFPSKKSRIKPSDINLSDIDTSFDIVIGLALSVNFDDLIQLQRVPLPYQGQHTGRLIAIRLWSNSTKVKKIRIRFANGDELLTHWPNRNITTPLSDTAPAEEANTLTAMQQTSKEGDSNMMETEEGDEDEHNNEENMFSSAAFDDLLGGSPNEWVSQFTCDTDAISIADEVAKLTNGDNKHGSSSQDDYAIIATGERVSIKQMQEMEEYFIWQRSHPPTFICNPPIPHSSSAAAKGDDSLHVDDDPEGNGPEPKLILIGKGKRLMKGDRAMQLMLQDVYIRDEAHKLDFLLSDIRFQIESEHLFGTSRTDSS